MTLVDLRQNPPEYEDYLEPCALCGLSSIRVFFWIAGKLNRGSGGYAHVIEVEDDKDASVIEGCLMQRGGVT